MEEEFKTIGYEGSEYKNKGPKRNKRSKRNKRNKRSKRNKRKLKVGGAAPEKQYILTINFLWISCTTFLPSKKNISYCKFCNKVKGEHHKPRSDNLDEKIKEINQLWGSIDGVILNFWYDSMYDNPPSDIEGINIYNLRDNNYKLSDAADKITGNTPLFMRIDYAKNVIMCHQIENASTEYSCFVDLDIEPQNFISDESIKKLDFYGIVLGSSSEGLPYENGFIMIKTGDEAVKESLKWANLLVEDVAGEPPFINTPEDKKQQFIWNIYPFLINDIFKYKFSGSTKYKLRGQDSLSEPDDIPEDEDYSYGIVPSFRQEPRYFLHQYEVILSKELEEKVMELSGGEEKGPLIQVVPTIYTNQSPSKFTTQYTL